MCATRNPFRLSRLRDIGWSLWDPIGLLEPDIQWKDEPFADEYDSYILRAAGMIANGQSDEAVAAYLASVEVDRMGLTRPDERDLNLRTLKVAIALREYVESELPAHGAERPKTVII